MAFSAWWISVAFSESWGLLSMPPWPAPSLMASLRHWLLLRLKDQPLSSIKLNQHTGVCPFLNPALPAAVVSSLQYPSLLELSFSSISLGGLSISEVPSAKPPPAVSGTSGIYCLFLWLERLLRFHPSKQTLPVIKFYIFQRVEASAWQLLFSFISNCKKKKCKKYTQKYAAI